MPIDTNTIIKESEQRDKKMFHSRFDPLTGEESTGERVKVFIKDMPLSTQYIPVEMLDDNFVNELLKHRTIKAFCRKHKLEYNEESINLVYEQWIRIRVVEDFPLAAYLYLPIQDKESSQFIPFKLNYPQRETVELYESMRKAGEPIRVVMPKARQWGGSTVTQGYMWWIQAIRMKGRNSAIVAHQNSASYTIRNMLQSWAKAFPVPLLYDMGEEYDPTESVMVGTPTPTIMRIPARDCYTIVSSAMNPDSVRSTSIYLAHLSEVALWKDTEQRKAADVVSSVVSSVPLRADTMIVYESSPLGAGNFFHKQYLAAKNGRGNFKAIFIAWWKIQWYTKQFKDMQHKREFAQWLFDNRNNTEVSSDYEQCGKYLWMLWEYGATLEGIYWYINKRSEFDSYARMASEFASDDIEAFQNSGFKVFSIYDINRLQEGIRDPKIKGELVANARTGAEALNNIKFQSDEHGCLSVWNYPETFDKEKCANRYVVSVDIGGRSAKADWSVITVLDRYDMMEGGVPIIVAQWRGHCDHDLLAWKATQIAKWYDDALLIFESNTLETKDKNRFVDGDQSTFILNEVREHYDNLYARKQSPEDIRNKVPKKYGFHTNVRTKTEVVSWLQTVLRDNLYIEREQQALVEYETYEEVDGKFNAIIGEHDDILMSRGIGLYVSYKEMDKPTFEQLSQNTTTVSKGGVV